ncbi:MAG: histidine kinase [Ornithinimicrobium sp.]|uniref:sensor histidine kinase n=1 Tax=Ornithinimicrobium sp. TaxID=1977084 RepID=UPI0026E06F8F|nr:histidine kinase [Ornithinimicrobium sp.]MDO5740082.1 histidine kinase [Ornithinimicrobium sp.]
MRQLSRTVVSALLRRRPTRGDVVALAVGLLLATLTTILVPSPNDTVLWLAAAYVYTAAGLLVRTAARARRTARALERRLLTSRAAPDLVRVETAVLDERRRLALDIRAVLQETLGAVRSSSAGLLRSEVDPAELKREQRLLRARTQLATSELRRLLGILRAAETEPSLHLSPPAHPGAVGPDHQQVATSLPHRPPSSDVVQSIVLMALAALECWVNRSTHASLIDPGVVFTTVLVAACFAGRTTAPVLTSVAQSLIFAIGFWVGAPVMSGVWLVRGVGAVLWRNALYTPRTTGLAATVLLSATVLATRANESTVGAGATAAVVVGSVAGGLITAWTGQREWAALAQEEAFRQEAQSQVERAIQSERVRLARELHDVIAHSVGLIAMQLNVLEVARSPGDRREALLNIQETSENALTELRDLNTFPDSAGSPLPRDLTQIEALVDRVRATGGHVDLLIVGEPAPEPIPVIYRILQESLTNAMQHAPGASVRVRLAQQADGVHLTIQDDGPGPRTSSPHRFGLVGLRERIALAGGRLQARTVGPGGGFIVDAFLPTQPGPTPGATVNHGDLQHGVDQVSRR